MSRVLLVALGLAVGFFLVVVAVVFVSGRAGRRSDAVSWTDLGFDDAGRRGTEVLAQWLDEPAPAVPRPDPGANGLTRLQHYPCQAEQPCDLHVTAVCVITRCCSRCSDNPAPGSAAEH